MTTIAQNTTPLPEIPYRGIESFRYVDQRVFCAREEETWDLLSNILINRGVLLYGDSGAGKSSLINAGLIPAAIKENLYAHRLRVQPRHGREIKIERISTETYDGPPYLLCDLFDPAATDDHAQSFEISLDDFYKQLDRLRGRAVDEPRPLLIFDQFEEFITLFEEASQKDAQVIQQHILDMLTSLLQDEGLPVKLLFVFREEYLAKLNILFKAAPELLDQYVRLLPPRVEEAEQIILAPFVDEELKERFATKPNHVRELEGLAKRIATQIQQRSENGFINLTELQIVCRKLWESPDPAKYFQSNGSDIQKVLEGYWILVPWIREKKAARIAQIEAERLAATTRQKLQQVEKERRILIVLGLVLLAGLVVSGLLYLRANRLQAELAREKDRVENLVRLLNHLTSSDPKERLDSVNGLIDLDKKGGLPRDLVPVIVAVTANEKNSDISYAANYFFNSLKEINEVQPTNSELTNSIIATAEQKNTVLTESRPVAAQPPRVYFQLASSTQRDRADKIAAALRAIGFIVPAYEVVEKGTPGNNQLRYYKTTDDSDQANQDNRNKALAKVREIDGQGWSFYPLPPASSVRSGTMELWFANDAAPGPSPSVSPSVGPDITLKLTFQNEQGYPLPVDKPRVTLEQVPYTGNTLIVRATSLKAAPGNYKLYVMVDGYRLYEAAIMLQDGEVNHVVILKPTPRARQPHPFVSQTISDTTVRAPM